MSGNVWMFSDEIDDEDLIEEKNMSEQRKIIHDDNNGLDYMLD